MGGKNCHQISKKIVTKFPNHSKAEVNVAHEEPPAIEFEIDPKN